MLFGLLVDFSAAITSPCSLARTMKEAHMTRRATIMICIFLGVGGGLRGVDKEVEGEGEKMIIREKVLIRAEMELKMELIRI
jgi:hypothetical protein